MPPKDHIDPILEAGYNVRSLRPDFLEVIDGWTAKSRSFREKHGGKTFSYGPGARDQLDLFACGKTRAPLLAFFHGGYWQSGDKSIYSFIAESFNGAEVDMALVGYPLCPNVSLSQIVSKARKAVSWLWRNADEIGVSADRINNLRSLSRRPPDWRLHNNRLAPIGGRFAERFGQDRPPHKRRFSGGATPLYNNRGRFKINPRRGAQLQSLFSTPEWKSQHPSHRW